MTRPNQMSQPNCANVRMPPERACYSSPASIPGTKSTIAMKTASAMMRRDHPGHAAHANERCHINKLKIHFWVARRVGSRRIGPLQ